jgi:vitamin B12 transporter
MQIAGTWARGFRAPTFNDLYLTAFQPFYTPNPDLRPEHSKSAEISLRSLATAPLQWRLTGFDNRFDDLIVANAETVMNVSRARIRGVEASIDTAWHGTRLRASITAQRPRDEDTGARLQGRAERFGTAQATHTFGAWTVGVALLASGDRYDSSNQAAGSRLPGYAIVDARLRYDFAKNWSAELTATNLADKRYESAVGYDAPRRSAFLNVRFQSY